MRNIVYKYFRIITLLFFIGRSSFTFGQSLNELKLQKEKTASEIEYINTLLKEASSNTKVSLNQLAVLNRKVGLQQNLINSIGSELNYLDQSIDQSSKRIDSLETELQSVKIKYAQMIRYAQRNEQSNNRLLFLLSSENFNQAYKRFIYLKQYADYRRKQSQRIVEFKDTISAQLNALNIKKGEKRNLLNTSVKETQLIEQQRKEENSVYTELKQKEKDLRKKLDNQRKVEIKLQQEIERLIAEEANKASRKSSKQPGLLLTPEEKLLSGDFSNNKSKLPWPVARGVITDHFGEHPHPVLKYVVVRNSGIDITTQANSSARAVFKGEVSKVVAIPGGNMAVIIRHGNYLTVYSNLSEVFVKAGQKVNTKEDIGRIFTDNDEGNKTVLKFQIWHESTKLNPEAWIL